MHTTSPRRVVPFLVATALFLAGGIVAPAAALSPMPPQPMPATPPACDALTPLTGTAWLRNQTSVIANTGSPDWYRQVSSNPPATSGTVNCTDGSGTPTTADWTASLSSDPALTSDVMSLCNDIGIPPAQYVEGALVHGSKASGSYVLPDGVDWAITFPAASTQGVITYTGCHYPTVNVSPIACPTTATGSITGPIEAGPGASTGWPVYDKDGKALPWSTTRIFKLSDKGTYVVPGLGQAWVSANGDPMLGYKTDAALYKAVMDNCVTGTMAYKVSTVDGSCTDVNGQPLTGSGDCRLIPGNYQSNLVDTFTVCTFQWINSANPNGARAVQSIPGTPSPRDWVIRKVYGSNPATNPIANGCSGVTPGSTALTLSETTQLSILCDNNWAAGWQDASYNFATCGTSSNRDPNGNNNLVCAWSSGNDPVITSMTTGQTVANGSPIIANGSLYKVTWPVPTVSGTDLRTEFLRGKGSSPFNPNDAVNGSKQPYLGTLSPTGTTNVLVDAATTSPGNSGLVSSVYVRLYRGGSYDNASGTILPFKVEARFSGAQAVTSSVLGTPTTWTARVSCTAPAAIIIAAQGRAA